VKENDCGEIEVFEATSDLALKRFSYTEFNNEKKPTPVCKSVCTAGGKLTIKCNIQKVHKKNRKKRKLTKAKLMLSLSSRGSGRDKVDFGAVRRTKRNRVRRRMEELPGALPGAAAAAVPAAAVSSTVGRADRRRGRRRLTEGSYDQACGNFELTTGGASYPPNMDHKLNFAPAGADCIEWGLDWFDIAELGSDSVSILIDKAGGEELMAEYSGTSTGAVSGMITGSL
jgi:hypothetical protein